MKQYQKILLLTLGLAVVLSGCSPAALEVTPVAGTAVVITAIVGTAEPDLLTELPPDFIPPPTPVLPTPTPIPTLLAGLGPSELKYRLLEEFPDFFFCDPDYYPVARADELELALQRFPEIRANREEFEAILEHNNLSGLSSFNDQQKLLIYQEHKKLAAIPFELSEAGYAFQIQVAETEGRGEQIRGTIDSQGGITIEERSPSIVTCPICLASGTLIDTPAGPIPVQDLRPGMPVWTVDAAGRRVAQPLLQVGKTDVPPSHQVIHLLLEDGRQVWVSPGHPTADGRRAGQLQPGDRLGGGQVKSAQRLPYGGKATYDVLPSGDTGFYWANGILLASSLANRSPGAP